MDFENVDGNLRVILNGTVPALSSRNENFLRTSEFGSKDENLNADNTAQSEIPTLQLLFKDEYQKKIASIENSDSFDINRKNQEKLNILQLYLQQLEEQNDVLMSSMIELEKEAYQRVKQMEKRLKSTAKSTMEAVVNIHDYEEEMRKLVTERLDMESILECVTILTYYHRWSRCEVMAVSAIKHSHTLGYGHVVTQILTSWSEQELAEYAKQCDITSTF